MEETSTHEILVNPSPDSDVYTDFVAYQLVTLNNKVDTTNQLLTSIYALLFLFVLVHFAILIVSMLYKTLCFFWGSYK